MNSKKITSYSDYVELSLGDLKLWGERDLSQFLIYDYFDAVEGIMGSRDAQDAFIKDKESLIKRCKKYRLVFVFFDWVFLKLYFFKKSKSKKNILARFSKDSPILLEVSKNYNLGLLAEGKQDRFFAIKNLIGYISINNLNEYILSYFKTREIKYLHELIEKLENKLRVAKPDYILLRTDSPPMERAIILAAKRLHIPTISVQHAMYDLNTPLFECNVADYILVWGEDFKDMYIEQNVRKPEDVYVLGYPNFIKKSENKREKDDSYTVCYLGQDIEKYNKNLLDVKSKIINDVRRICEKLELKFIYRPHPGESIKLLSEILPGVQLTPKKEKLEEVFDKADIFISFSSTSLIEAAMRSMVALQLMNYPILSDNFEELRACSKSFKSTEQLEKYLAEIASAKSLDDFKPVFNNEYIETRYNPRERFLEIIKEIEDKRKNEK